MRDFKNDLKRRLSGEGTSSSVLTLSVISVVLALNVVFYILAITLGLYIVPKEGYKIELSGATDSLFAEAMAEKRTVKITFCYPEEDLKAHDTGKLVYKTVTDLEAKYPDFIDVEYVNIITKRNSKGEIVPLEKYTTDMRGNETQIRKSSVIFESGRNYRVLTDLFSSSGFADFYTMDSEGYTTSYNGEEVVAAMISWVLHDEHKTAYLTTSHSEQADAAFANMLSCAGYYVDTVNLKSTTLLPNDENIGLVIISNPQSDFEKAAEGSGIRTEMEWLESYVGEYGGSLYVSLDPYVKNLPVLESFLESYGLKLSKTELEGRKINNIVKDPDNGITTDGFTFVASYADTDGVSSQVSALASSYVSGGVLLREVSAIEVSGNARPLLVSSSTSVCEAGGSTVMTGGGYCVGAYSESEANFEGQRGRILLLPSIYAAVADALVANGYSNKEFIYSSFEVLFGAEGIPHGCLPVLYNNSTLENLTMGAARLYLMLILSVPAAIAVTGFVITIRRKNR